MSVAGLGIPEPPDNRELPMTWSPASRAGFCVKKLVLVSAQNTRPSGDPEALARAILRGHSILLEAIVRGQQGFEDATTVLPEGSAVPSSDSVLASAPAEVPQDDDGPLPSINLENEFYNEPVVTVSVRDHRYPNEPQL